MREPRGIPGPPGPPGKTGATGKTGARGATGKTGVRGLIGKPDKRTRKQRKTAIAQVNGHIEKIYKELDIQLKRMAQIQYEVDQLRAKIQVLVSLDISEPRPNQS